MAEKEIREENMKVNIIGIGFICGATAGILFNSLFNFGKDIAVQVIIITTVAGLLTGALIGRNK